MGLTIIFSLALSFLLFLWAQPGQSEHEADWQWLVQQVRSGASVIVLPNDITREGDEGLFAENPITIDGNGFSLKEAIVDGGQITFYNATLLGVHGLDDENGGTALTLRGDGAIVIFTGHTSAVGGRSGPIGEYGGDGVRLTGKKQGLILRNKTSATGGTGYFIGGAGIRVVGCECTVLMADSAACIGKPGLGVGGAGIQAVSCATASFNNHATSAGGGSVYTGGAGVLSIPCQACKSNGNVKALDQTMITGGVGATGGAAVRIEREPPKDLSEQVMKAALRVEGKAILVGGHGGKAGPAISAIESGIYYKGTPSLFSGNFYESETPILDYQNCIENGTKDTLILFKGNQLPIEAYPAKDMSSIISSELRQANDRYTPAAIENGLTKRGLTHKYNGMSVERGKTGRAGMNGTRLFITLWNGSYEKRLDFTQLLGSDGADGTLYALVATRSEECLAAEVAVSSFEKLTSLGITQFAYTMNDPVYYERIVDIRKLLNAVYAQELPVDTVILGTVDDSVIFVYEGSKKWVYQEDLMDRIRVVLEALPEEEEKSG